MDLDALLSRHNDAVSATARHLCGLITDVVEGAGMDIDPPAIHFRLAERFCTVWPKEGHVTLMFAGAGGFSDPAQVLQGAGTNRYLHVRDIQELDLEQVTHWLEQAVRGPSDGIKYRRAAGRP